MKKSVKRFIATAAGITMLGAAAISGVGCAKKVDGGTEAAKLLLARERLDENALDSSLDFWKEESPSLPTAVSKAVEKSGLTAKALSVKNAADTRGLAITPTAEFTNGENYYEWADFPAYSDSLGSLESFVESVEDDAEEVAKMIGVMKNKVGITDKWVKGVARGSDHYMLRVEDDTEYLYSKNPKQEKGYAAYTVAKRQTRADAKNIYEMYSYYNYQDGTTGDIRMQYIPGERYESMYDNSNGFNDYVIVEKSRGYWTTMRFNGRDGLDYSFDVSVIKDGLGYNTFLTLNGDGEPSAAWYTVFDPVAEREIFRISYSWKSYYINTHFSAIKSGLQSVRVYGDLRNEAYVERGGYEYSNAPLTLVTANGEVAAGSKVGDVEYTEAVIQYDPMEHFYHGYFALEIDTSEWAPCSEALEKLQVFYDSCGIELYCDMDVVERNFSLAKELAESFGSTYEWNGYKLSNLENMRKANEVLYDWYAASKAEYERVKDFETVSARQKLARGVDFASFASMAGGESSYKDGVVTVPTLTANIKDTKLFENGLQYELKIGLALRDEKGELHSENTVALEGGTGAAVTFDGSEMRFEQSGDFVLPKNLSSGEYMVVAYVATAAEGIRVSKMQPIAFLSSEDGSVTSEAMEIQVNKSGENLLVTYSVKLKKEVEIVQIKESYTYAEIRQILMREILAAYYPAPNATLENASGDALNGDETLTEGGYRMKCYVATADGLAEAYVYCVIPTAETVE